MLLPQLQEDISRALAQLRSTKVNSTAVATCISSVSAALAKSSIRPEIIAAMSDKLEEAMNIDARSSMRSNLLRVEQIFFKRLRQIFFADIPFFVPQKGSSSIVWFLDEGLLPDVAMKYAKYHKCRGYDVRVVCALRLGWNNYVAFRKRVKQADIAFHGSFQRMDVASTAREGIRGYKKSKADIIILFAREDVLLQAEAVPDLTLATIDARVGGQVAFQQSNMLKSSYPSCAVIITGIMDHSNAGGAISSVAAAKLPLLYVDKGYDSGTLEIFDSEILVTHLLGIRNRMIEINTWDFQNIFVNVGASEDEETNVIEKLTEALMLSKRQQLDQCKSLSHEIYTTETQYNELCDSLGEKAAKNSRIKSLEERLQYTRMSMEVLKDTKRKRLEELAALQLSAKALSQFLKLPSEEQELHFLVEDSDLTLEKVLDVNGLCLSSKLLALVKKYIYDLEGLKSKSLTKVFQKMDALDKFLQDPCFLKDPMDFRVTFTKADIESGVIAWNLALERVEALKDKAENCVLRSKVLLYEARSLFEDQNSTSQHKIDVIGALLLEIEKWESEYNLQLLDEHDTLEGSVHVETKLRALLKLVKKLVPHAPATMVEEPALCATKVEALADEAMAPLSAVVTDVNMSSNSTGSEGNDGSEGASSDQSYSEIDDEINDPDYSPTDDDTRQ